MEPGTSKRLALMVIFKGDYLMLIDGINHDFIAQME